MWSCRLKIGQKSRSFWGGAQGRVHDRHTNSLIASLRLNYRKNGYCKIFGKLSSPSRFLMSLRLHFRWLAEVRKIALLVHGRIAQRSVQIHRCLQSKSTGWCDLRRKESRYPEQVHLTNILGSASCHESGVSLNFSTTPTTRSSWPMVEKREDPN